MSVIRLCRWRALLSSWEGKHGGPFVLLRRLKLGREEFCQRLLTMLILEAPYPPWNTSSVPSARGLEFLRRVDRLSFGSSDLAAEVEFVDELDLPGRVADDRGAAPDYGLISADRLWIIELKTEVGSHRAAQVPTYFVLGRHHYPGRHVDLTYLTPAMAYTAPEPPQRCRFAHVTWEDVVPFIAEAWSDVEGDLAAIRAALLETLGTIGRPWTEWRHATLDDVLGIAVRQARLTAADGQQRVLDYPAGSLEELQELRVAVRDALRASPPDDGAAQPWLWNVATTDGHALFAAGREAGYELRFSRSRAL